MAIIDVIKYSGGNNVLVWKHPKEDFNTSAQLIVNQAQEAIVYRDGVMSAPYGPGKHTIETENLPGVRKIVGLVTGGVSPNHYEVYYINKAYSMEILWATSSSWTIQDPTLEIPFSMRVRGQSAVRVVDSQMLMTKLVGTMTSFTDREIKSYFRGKFTALIKDYISNVMQENSIGYASINTKLLIISEKVSAKITNMFEKYGLVTEDFVIESIEVIEDEYLKQIKDAQAQRAANIIKGVTEQEKMGFEIAKAQASNQGTGGQMGSMITGIATGAAVAPAVAGVTRNVLSGFNTAYSSVPDRPDQFSMGSTRNRVNQTVNTGSLKSNAVCASCGKEIPTGSRFCNHCGASQVETKQVQCPVCGEQCPAGSMFCPSCGERL